jgi:hypothetical protein
MGLEQREDCGFRIADCETGNPPEGWESEGQFQKKQKTEILLWERLSAVIPRFERLQRFTAYRLLLTVS